MDNVRELPGVAKTANMQTEPNRDLIEQLESYLEEAKRGDLQALGIITVYRDGASGAGWVGDSRGDLIQVLGEGQILIHRLSTAIHQSDIDYRDGT